MVGAILDLDGFSTVDVEFDADELPEYTINNRPK